MKNIDTPAVRDIKRWRELREINENVFYGMHRGVYFDIGGQIISTIEIGVGSVDERG